MSAAGVPVTLNQDFAISRNTAQEICVGPANVNAANPFKSACYTKLLGGNGLLLAKYMVLSYLVIGEVTMWAARYAMKNPSNPNATQEQANQALDLIFQQLPLGAVAPLEDNGAAWGVDVVNKAMAGVMTGFNISADDFNSSFKPLIVKYIGGGGGGGGGGGNNNHNKWLGMPMWFWVVLLILLVLAAGGMYMKKQMGGGGGFSEFE